MRMIHAYNVDLLTNGRFECGRLYPYERLKFAIVSVGATISRPEILLCQQVQYVSSFFSFCYSLTLCLPRSTSNSSAPSIVAQPPMYKTVVPMPPDSGSLKPVLFSIWN